MRLAKNIFGLDNQLVLELEIKETTRFKLMLFLFFSLVIASFFGGGYLGFIVTSNLLVASISGLFIGFIFFNILRFSICSVERNYSSKENKIFSFTLLLKLLILFCVGSFFAFPLAAFIQRPTVENQIKEYKSQILQEYQIHQEEKLAADLMIFNDQIEIIEKKKGSLKIRINEIENSLEKAMVGSKDYQDLKLEEILSVNELDKLINEQELLKENSLEFEEKSQNDLISRNKSFKAKILSNEQAIFQLTKISTNKLGSLVIMVILTFISILVIGYTKLIYSNQYKYGKLSYLVSRELIKKSYFETKQNCNTFLLHKYGFADNTKELYHDPPFNSKKIEAKNVSCLYSNFGEFIKTEIRI